MKLLKMIRALFSRRKRDDKMTEEMRLHVELQSGLHVKVGLNPDEARYAALRQFGNVASIQEQCRAQRRWVWLESWARDLRLAARSLGRSPGFSLSVFLTLVLCIGPNTAVLSALYALVIRPLPFQASSQLVLIKNVGTKAGNLVNSSGLPQYQDFAAQADRFARLALFEAANTTIGEDSVPTRALGYRVTVDFFNLLGVAPQLGRFFLSDDYFPSIKTISNGFSVKPTSAWRCAFGPSPVWTSPTISALPCSGSDHTRAGAPAANRNATLAGPSFMLYKTYCRSPKG